MSETDTQNAAATLEAPANIETQTETVIENIEISSVSSESESSTRPLRDPVKPDKDGYIKGTGRRKSSVARVRIKPGTGNFVVNNKDVDEFFTIKSHQATCRAPMKATNTLNSMDVFVNVKGGGYTGQADAILLGVARSLLGYDPTLESTLRDHGYLTRDSREVERKKYGLAGARKSYQFSKR